MTRPNILLITADQWRGDALGAMHHPVVKTPALDALAAEATVFERHISTCAPCSPARASLYTGLYQMNHRVVTNGTPLDDRFDNIARAGRRAGYRPTLFGYTDTSLDPRLRDPADPDLASYEEVLPGFELRQPLREDDAAWKAWLTRRGHNADVVADPHRVALAGGVSLSPPAYGADETPTAFLTESLLDWHQEQSGPWFAHISYLRPHPPFVVPEPYASMHDPAAMPRAQPLPDAPHMLVDMTRALAPAESFQPGLPGTIATLTDQDIARIRAIYFGMISEVDAQLGRLFETLKARGDWDNTLVIFTSDHGEMLGDYSLFGKGGFYVESQHIPLMIRMPGAAPGRVTGFTSSTDIFPTLLELWGLTPRHAPDGRSLMPEIASEAQGRDWAVWEFDFRHAMPEEQRTRLGLDPRACHLVVLRTSDAHYVHSPAFAPLAFDLSSDPYCTTPDPRPDRQAALAQMLLTRITQLRDETLAATLLPASPT